MATKESVKEGTALTEVGTQPGKEVSTSRSEMTRLAITGGADLTQLERLFELQLRDEANEARKAYVIAMTAFKANPPEIYKDRPVAYKEVKYKHASLANVAEKINAALSEHGLFASWTTQQNGAVSVTCKITHIKGHSEETTLSAPADNSGSKNGIQAIGSTITYLQRYTILSLTGLATTDQDDDGVASSEACITDNQVHVLLDWIADTETNTGKFLKYMKADSIQEIPAGKYNQALSALQQKKKEQDSKKKLDRSPGEEG